MKNKFAEKKIIKMICLLMTVGILCIIPRVNVYATIDEGNTGERDTTTVVNEPGSAESGEELPDLTMANALSITQSGDKGQLNGTLRILITLTLIALAPTLLIMLTSFTRIIIVLHFTRAALNTQTAPPNQGTVFCSTPDSWESSPPNRKNQIPPPPDGSLSELSTAIIAPKFNLSNGETRQIHLFFQAK